MQDVVHERDHRRDGEGELEPNADKRHDDEQRRRHGLQRLVPELLPEGRAHARDADLGPERLCEGVLAPPAARASLRTGVRTS